jgi:hypothetical protein
MIYILRRMEEQHRTIINEFVAIQTVSAGSLIRPIPDDLNFRVSSPPKTPP